MSPSTCNQLTGNWGIAYTPEYLIVTNAQQNSGTT